MMLKRSLAFAVVLASVAPAARAQDAAPRRYALGQGDTISVTVTGEGPAVVIVPGLLGSRFSFRHIIPALVASGHQVLVVDPLGTGTSSRPQHGDYSLEAQAGRVRQVMDSAGVADALLLCHSVGASICYRLALHSPERVTGIVAVNGGPDERAATNGLRRALKFAPVLHLLGSGSLRGKLRAGLIDSSVDPSWVTEEVVDAYTRPFRDLRVALRGMRGMAAATEPAALGPRLSSLRVPVMLLIGGTPGAISPQAIATMEQNVPDITIARVSDAGQYIQEENPAAIIQAVATLRAESGAARPQPQRPVPDR